MSRDQQFAEFVEQRWSALVRSAVLLGCSTSEAEDLVQAALVRCYIAWRRVAAADDRDAYVYRVLLNTHHDSRRRQWWGEEPTAVLPEMAQADETARIDDAHAIGRALQRLSAAHRQVVVLRYYAHLTEQQIAGVLDIAAGTVKSRLSRALSHLSTDTELANLRGDAS
jgi:RNA polymerase sigma-70 factor (sigma-E family)